MTRRKRQVFVGESELRVPGPAGDVTCVDRDGERFYRITDYHAMPPFFMSVVSAYDHWLFVSSTGGLTCGRRDPGNALFPYCTDDKIHDACETTGPRTVLLVTRNDRTTLWQPFDTGPVVHDVERNLYKNVPGNKLVFEEFNRDLGVAFSYCWATGDRFGFVRKSRLANLGRDDVRVALLDGLRNLLPYGVSRAAQAEMSTLVDGYKQAEIGAGACAGIFTLSSILTDRAEPSEALKATVVWSTGLDQARVLLSEDQVAAFRAGEEPRAESSSKGKRGAFFVGSEMTLTPQDHRDWYLLADLELGAAQTGGLLETIRRGVTAEAIERDVAEGTARLERLAGGADGFQRSSDELRTGRHFSNTLFNIMRGGVFPHGYRFPRADFLDFVGRWNRPAKAAVERSLEGAEGSLTLQSARTLAEASGNPDFIRLVFEYLPLTFSRRHGDPSRPWNHFSIQLTNPEGAEYLYFQGNWRDIFQNWEALALSFPEFIESFIAKFVNASTADGHNPYRISREGLDWEAPEPGVPWSNIGYWGDHQVVYLLRLLELSRAYHPGLLGSLLDRVCFVYADVPYRIKPYRELLAHPRDSVDYDDDCESSVARRIDDIGVDGKLAVTPDGSIHRVNLLEKLLVTALAKIGNLVPGGGIWMNTQRPEWNDANNALVGYGLSVVTVCYLRRYLHELKELLEESDAATFALSVEVRRFFDDIRAALEGHLDLLEGPVDAVARKSFMDAMGAANDAYRASVYGGMVGDTAPLEKRGLQEFATLALRYLDHSLAIARREDGLFDAYNLIRFDSGGFDVEPLEEMLEGQVAALSSGYLDNSSALALLQALRASRLYREDQNSYLLYPDRKLPSFLDKNVIPASLWEHDDWIRRQLEQDCRDYVERALDGRVHFNGIFRNAQELRAALERDPAVDAAAVERLCDVYEAVFAHRKFTGRSGSMYKYEGLGCIYWHMVSKLLLANGERIVDALGDDAHVSLVEPLLACFREIEDGIGTHKPPALYGAFPVDPYSHTPGFAGVQQPGLTGQVKEDVITRFLQLGVRVDRGEVSFRPALLARGEFLREAATWSFTAGGPRRTEELPAGSLAFTLCGVPVIYRIADTGRVQVFGEDGVPSTVRGANLGPELSRSLFRRDPALRKLIVDIPKGGLG